MRHDLKILEEVIIPFATLLVAGKHDIDKIADHVVTKSDSIIASYIDHLAVTPYIGPMSDGLTKDLGGVPVSEGDYLGIQYAWLTENDAEEGFPAELVTSANQTLDEAERRAKAGDTRMMDRVKKIALLGLRTSVLVVETNDMSDSMANDQATPIQSLFNKGQDAIKSLPLAEGAEKAVGKVLTEGLKLVGGIPGIKFGADNLINLAHAFGKTEAEIDVYLTGLINASLNGIVGKGTPEAMAESVETFTAMLPSEIIVPAVSASDYAVALATRMMNRYTKEMFSENDPALEAMRLLWGISATFDAHQDLKNSRLRKAKIFRTNQDLADERQAAATDGQGEPTERTGYVAESEGETPTPVRRRSLEELAIEAFQSGATRFGQAQS